MSRAKGKTQRRKGAKAKRREDALMPLCAHHSRSDATTGGGEGRRSERRSDPSPVSGELNARENLGLRS
jgi:hypothetical protein